ncbi:MAG: hypothetical protein H6Q86_3385 [candidate division NC10 bacterium]|nr:hypothetical protein [candidate division NC10 bacterium]
MAPRSQPRPTNPPLIAATRFPGRSIVVDSVSAMCHARRTRAWLHSLTERLSELGLNDGRGNQGRPANRKPRVSETDQVDEVKRTP